MNRKRLYIALKLWFVVFTFLASCKSSENFLNPVQNFPSASPTLAQSAAVKPMETATVTSTYTPTVTATITPTPIPKELSYHVVVDCMEDESIAVELNYSGEFGSTASFAFNYGGFNWRYPNQKESILREIEARNSGGELLSITERRGDNGNTVFQVPVQGDKAIQIHYRVNVGFWSNDDNIFQGGTYLGGYIGKDYCVIEPALLFLTPLDIRHVDDIQASFSVPEDWDVVTFWEKNDDGYYSTAPYALRMSKGPFGFGKFITSEKMIGDTRVVVAAANGVYQPNEQLEKALDLYDHYQTEVFGVRDVYYGNEAPRDGYVVIFIPATGPFYNLYHEEYGLYMSLQNQAWDNFAHMLSHNWTMDQERANAPWYITEGIVEYLQVKMTLEMGYISEARYTEHLRYKYNWYMGVQGTSEDYSFVEAPTSHDIQYHKGALMALLLDETLKSVTNGEIDIQDLMQYLYEKASESQLDTRAIEELASELSNYDFSEFFDRYIYGTEKLPIVVDWSGTVVVDYDTYPILGEE